MHYAAFLRNLNQGQRNNPSSAQLIESFESAGASDVSLVRGNGTVRFSAEDPIATAEAAAALLTEPTGWKDAVFVRSLAEIANFLALVDDTAAAGTVDARNFELSLFDAAMTPVPPVEGRRCSVLTAGPGFAIVRNDRENESNGTPTLERALKTKVTSRGMPTVWMLVP